MTCFYTDLKKTSSTNEVIQSERPIAEMLDNPGIVDIMNDDDDLDLDINNASKVAESRSSSQNHENEMLNLIENANSNMWRIYTRSL